MSRPIGESGVEKPDVQMATAVLIGGPGTIPDELRKRPVAIPCDTIKIAHHGGYEHFVPTVDDPVPGVELVFEWITRTRIAE